MDTNYTANYAWQYDAASLNAASILGGANDILIGTSAALMQSAVASLCGKAHATGFKTIVGTVTPSTSFTAGQEVIRLAFNAYVRANWQSFADALVDFARIPELLNPSNATYYVDGLHPTPTGAAFFADLVRRATGFLVFGNTLGAELITNGAFGADTTGWSAFNSTLAAVAGELRITGSAAAAQANELITFEIGSTYVVQCKARKGTSDVITAQVVRNDNFAVVGKDQCLDTNTQFLCFRFVATQTTHYIGLFHENAGTGTSFWDDVSIKKLT